MPVAVALKRLVTARALFALLFAAFFFLSRLVMLTAGTLTALHRVTAAAGREGRPCWEPDVRQGADVQEEETAGEG